MRKIWIILLLLTAVSLSCSAPLKNGKEINVKGYVIDNITKSPISDAKVTVLCWYHAGSDKNDYISIDTITDKKGFFNVKFEEGYKVIAASVGAKYYPNLTDSGELNSNDVSINVELKKRNDTAGVKINLRYYIVQNSSD
jgi:hypothetical protein